MNQLPQTRETEWTPETKKKVAYALNLCMVSVSQIIDYDDIYILEQEYDAILNNLNLEEMPKDIALKDILTQLLNVITFFRIQEGDKVFVERDYQQRMKDAIWSAVPNPGIMLAGGNLATMAVSLITQVGIGYMNYRRYKSEIQLEHEKSQWKLQRAAMEQFNGLRRELFDTAWSLAKEYNFPDEYRITERQITRYNKILMDRDPLRRYERLSSIAKSFQAYPPFFYFWGNAANMASQNERYDPETRGRLRVEACDRFKTFLEETEHHLLREDHVLAACALEYFDILASSNTVEVEYLEHLLDRAIKASGSAFDVLQLCAVAYLKIGSIEKAAYWFRILVNEEYNTNMNAQLLSALYVGQYLRGDQSAKGEYETLRTRVTEELLFPFPKSNDVGTKALQEDFIHVQQQLLLARYNAVKDAVIAHYSVQFNRVIPTAQDEIYPDSYFDDACKDRRQDILQQFDRDHTRNEYVMRLSNANIGSGIIRVLNEMYAAVGSLPCMEENTAAIEQFYELVQKEAQEQGKMFRSLLENLYNDNPGTVFDREQCKGLLSFRLDSFAGEAFDALDQIIEDAVTSLNAMDELIHADSRLLNFCKNQGLAYPEVQIPTTGTEIQLGTSDSMEKSKSCAPQMFGENLFGRMTGNQMWRALVQKKRQDGIQEMMNCIRKYREALETWGKGGFTLYTQGEKDGRLLEIIQKDEELKKIGFSPIIAILKDTSKGEHDLVFTANGVRSYLHNTLFGKSLSSDIAYDSIKLVPGPALKIGRHTFKSAMIDIIKLSEMIDALSQIEQRYDIWGRFAMMRAIERVHQTRRNDHA